METKKRASKLRNVDCIFYDLPVLEEVLDKKNLPLLDYSKQELSKILTKNEFNQIHTKSFKQIMNNLQIQLMVLAKEGEFTEEESGFVKDGYSTGLVEEMAYEAQQIESLISELEDKLNLNPGVNGLSSLFKRIFFIGINLNRLVANPWIGQVHDQRVNSYKSNDRLRPVKERLFDIYEKGRISGRFKSKKSCSEDKEVHKETYDLSKKYGNNNSYNYDAWKTKLYNWLIRA